MIRGLRGLLMPAIVLPALLLNTAAARAGGPVVLGAGSTWVQIALDQWRADIARQGYTINYQGVGSSAGRQFFTLRQVDFAASEIPFQPDEIPALVASHQSYQYVPDVAGGTSLMYNLHTPNGDRIRSLRLDAGTAAGIFTGTLTSWHDPAIQALNPGLQIRESGIKAVIRSDGSGTSAQFSLYLQDQATAAWARFVALKGCPAPCSLWPEFDNSASVRGSDGVAGYVADDQIGSGSIGYVEAGYAYGRYFPVANLKNASGNFVQPSATNVAQALTHARLNPDLTQDLTFVYRAPEANAYPMSSYSYLITRTTGFDPAKGYVLGTWMIYIACGGQRQAPLLGYSALPPNLVGFVFDAVRRIPGAPTPPPLDRQHCPNPTIGTGAQGPTVAATSSYGNGHSGAGSATSSPGTAAGSAATGSTSSPNAASSSGAAGSSPGGTTAAALEAQATLTQTGAGTIIPNLMVTTMDDNQRKVSLLQAERLAGQAAAPTSAALPAAALLLLVLAFMPMLLQFLRRPSTTMVEGETHAD